jgi:glycyl-tRNA synthetase beta chain
MGRYYALAEGALPVVAEAIEQHYRPRFAGDALPDSNIGRALALADKLDSLVGFFGIGQLPTGDRTLRPAPGRPRRAAHPDGSPLPLDSSR